MPSVDVRLKFDEDQLTALDAYREHLYNTLGVRVSRSQAIRDAVGQRVRAAGIDWPDDPQLGGDRRSPAAVDNPQD